MVNEPLLISVNGSASPSLDNSEEIICWDDTSKDLLECLDFYSEMFLGIIGIRWPKKCSILQYSWNVLMMLIAFSFYIMLAFGNFTATDNASVVLIVVAFLLQGVCLIASTYLTHSRLRKPAKEMELRYFAKSLWAAVLCLLTFYATCIPLGVINGNGGVKGFSAIIYAFTAIALWAQSGLIAVNLFFLLVDASTSTYLVEHLIILQKQGKLSHELYNRVREEVQRRMEANSLNNFINMGVAFLNVMVVVIAFLLSKKIFTNTLAIATLVAAMSREIIYIMVGCWEIAKVNEKSDELTKLLGLHLDSQVEYGYAQQRMYCNAASNPITYELAGMRLLRKEIIFKFFLWVIGLVIGIAQQK